MNSNTSLKVIQPVIKKDQPDDTFNFQPLPEPTGAYPFELFLDNVIPDINPNKIVFQMVGDTGSTRNTSFQKLVVEALNQQFAQAGKEKPQFLLHLGDIVYNHGEESRYYEQFFSGFKNYPAPIFAIAGNHDSDVNPLVPEYKSLDAFMKVFCGAASKEITFNGDIPWKSGKQPNIYWTLKAPLVNVICLYSNVPKYGVVTSTQRQWFKEALVAAHKERYGKALLVCIHHAPYSADINHGSSIPMIEFLNDAFETTGVKPDAVFSGHVHNYQRIHKKYADGKVVPFFVSGAGGYDELHPIAELNDNGFIGDSSLFKDVKLMKYCDDQHGFLNISIEKKDNRLQLSIGYNIIKISMDGTPHFLLYDQFKTFI